MNKKGFTLIELITTFALAAVLIILLINIVVLIKNIYNQSNIKSKMAIEQSTLSKLINEEFSKGLKSYSYCMDSSFCYEFTFKDSTTSKLIVEERKIQFNDYVYKLDKGVSVKEPSIAREFVDISDPSDTSSFLTIKIPIYSELYPNTNFGIDLTTIGDIELVLVETNICTLISGMSNTIGSKYQCKVKDSMEEGFEDGYYFYVLSYNDETGKIVYKSNNTISTNLILDRNIYYDSTADIGLLATTTNKGLVAWYENDRVNTKGPVTANAYLHNATKDWDKVSSSEKKSRLPQYKETKNAGCKSYSETGSSENGSCPVWLVNYLSFSSVYSKKDGYVYDKVGLGYWLSSDAFDIYGYNVDKDGYLDIDYVDETDYNGVRPVITVILD